MYNSCIVAAPKTPQTTVGYSLNTSLELRWSQENEIKSFVSKYTVHFRPKLSSAKLEIGENPWKNVSIDADRMKMNDNDEKFSGSYVIEGLECGRTYEAFVTSENAVEKSEIGKILSVKTLGSS